MSSGCLVGAIARDHHGMNLRFIVGRREIIGILVLVMKQLLWLCIHICYLSLFKWVQGLHLHVIVGIVLPLLPLCPSLERSQAGDTLHLEVVEDCKHVRAEQST